MLDDTSDRMDSIAKETKKEIQKELTELRKIEIYLNELMTIAEKIRPGFEIRDKIDISQLLNAVEGKSLNSIRKALVSVINGIFDILDEILFGFRMTFYLWAMKVLAWSGYR